MHVKNKLRGFTSNLKRGPRLGFDYCRSELEAGDTKIQIMSYSSVGIVRKAIGLSLLT